jgi:cysteinyl-tRNA synthetase
VTLQLFNTLAREKQRFEPIDPDNVRMYVCGPTVYDDAHIGNARPAVVFDVLFRLLRHLYGAEHVTYVRNVTDVDDKIIAAHHATGEPIATLTERTARAYREEIQALGCLVPTVEPRATEHIPEMVATIARVIERGHAYAADGHVLFDVPSMLGYGALSRRDLDEMIAGARVEVAPYKRDPRDFVLWKPSAPEDPGWDSPWGRGRPGWHIECSAMSCRYLGETFDIHGGGADLIFPHHENEIAQSTCAHDGRPLARWWVHNGYLMTEGEKMSKSLGNFYTIRDLLREFPGEAIRLVLLQTHYRQPLDFTREGLAEAKHILDRFYIALRAAQGTQAALEGTAPAARANVDAASDVLEALCDDLNTPLALSVLHERLADLNKAEGEEKRARAKSALLASANILGLLADDPRHWLQENISSAPSGMSQAIEFRAATAVRGREWIERRIEERDAARRQRDFPTADRIRADLAAVGVILEDTPQGTTWRRA